MTADLSDARQGPSAEARDSFWRSIGDGQPDAIAYASSPQFTGSPAWPTSQQAFRVVRCAQSIIIASDGLTGLFAGADLQSPGLETEVFIETDELAGADFEEIRESWAFSLIENFARNVAYWGGIRQRLDKHGVITVELPAPDQMPPAWVDEEGMVGCLANIPSDRTRELELAAGASISMTPLTIITPAELAFLAEGGAAARESLAQELLDKGYGIVCRTGRVSLR